MEKFSIQVQIVNNKNEHPEEKVAYTVALSGPQVQQVTVAYDALEMLFGMCLQKIVLDKNIGNI
jgi:hypothetical protein